MGTHYVPQIEACPEAFDTARRFLSKLEFALMQPHAHAIDFHPEMKDVENFALVIKNEVDRIVTVARSI